MSNFNEREKDFENKYAYEAKMSFKIEARCAKLMGLWAAEKLGLEDSAATDYAMASVAAKLESPGFEGVERKIVNDFKQKNIDISEHLVKVQLDKTLEEAREQVLSEGA